jgi:hypothetical protein
MKQVLWKDEFGEKMPFCPYCNEPIYVKGECIFCKKKHEWVELKQSETVVEVGEYAVIQTANNHIHVMHNGAMIMHINCTKKMTEDELRGMVSFCETKCETKCDTKCETKKEKI